MGELRARNADIICLQEVEHDAYESYFRANLAHDDYKGAFWPKGRAKTMGPNEAKLVDGCATFWKHSKYVFLGALGRGLLSLLLTTWIGICCSINSSSTFPVPPSIVLT
jgi:mRNA deadenylase 3'-5' endonuclease subunit Ccr4